MTPSPAGTAGHAGEGVPASSDTQRTAMDGSAGLACDTAASSVKKPASKLPMAVAMKGKSRWADEDVDDEPLPDRKPAWKAQVAVNVPAAPCAPPTPTRPPAQPLRTHEPRPRNIDTRPARKDFDRRVPRTPEAKQSPVNRPPEPEIVARQIQAVREMPERMHQLAEERRKQKAAEEARLEGEKKERLEQKLRELEAKKLSKAGSLCETSVETRPAAPVAPAAAASSPESPQKTKKSPRSRHGRVAQASPLVVEVPVAPAHATPVPVAPAQATPVPVAPAQATPVAPANEATHRLSASAAEFVPLHHMPPPPLHILHHPHMIHHPAGFSQYRGYEQYPSPYFPPPYYF